MLPNGGLRQGLPQEVEQGHKVYKAQGTTRGMRVPCMGSVQVPSLSQATVSRPLVGSPQGTVARTNPPDRQTLVLPLPDGCHWHHSPAGPVTRGQRVECRCGCGALGCQPTLAWRHRCPRGRRLQWEPAGRALILDVVGSRCLPPRQRRPRSSGLQAERPLAQACWRGKYCHGSPWARRRKGPGSREHGKREVGDQEHVANMSHERKKKKKKRDAASWTENPPCAWLLQVSFSCRPHWRQAWLACPFPSRHPVSRWWYVVCECGGVGGGGGAVGCRACVCSPHSTIIGCLSRFVLPWLPAHPFPHALNPPPLGRSLALRHG